MGHVNPLCNKLAARSPVPAVQLAGPHIRDLMNRRAKKSGPSGRIPPQSGTLGIGADPFMGHLPGLIHPGLAKDDPVEIFHEVRIKAGFLSLVPEL